MKTFRVGSSGTVAAPPARVYAVIADYRQHHPQIVPPEYFRGLEVVAGGVGAGTRTRFEMRVLGTTRKFEHVITEPEPGRVLVEADEDGSNATTFVVEAGERSGSTRLTITTELAVRPGIAGMLERAFSSVLLPRIYRKEIARLAEYVARLPAT